MLRTRLLRKVFGPKMEKVAEDCRKLHNEELHELQSSLNINWVIKSRMIRWAGPVVHMRQVLAGLCWRNMKKISLLGRPNGSEIKRMEGCGLE